MSSSYKKKEKPFTENDVVSAVKEVKEGASLRQVASKYKMDKMFLHRKVNGTHSGVQGRKTDLTAKQETTLATHLKTLAKWGFPMTRAEVMLVVQDFVEQNGLSTRFKEGKPGAKWFRNFCVRNSLTLKKPETLEANRRKATSDPFIIYDFYDKLQTILEELDIKDNPKKIWNLDETYFSADPTRIRAVAGIGQKFFRDIQGSGKDNTTVLACVSADGTCLPPLVIFEGSHLWSSWKGSSDLPGTFYSNAVNGFMTASIFSSYFNHFCGVVKERPLLLLLDGHLSHLDPTVIEKAKNENVAIMKLPPHTTDQLQPLDKCCFKPFKDSWNLELIQWQRSNQRTLSKSEFVNLVCKVWPDALKAKNIISGFKATGICPYDRTKYPVHRLDPDKLQRYNITTQNTVDVGLQEVTNVSNDLVPINISDDLEPTNISSNLETPNVSLVLEPANSDNPICEQDGGIVLHENSIPSCSEMAHCSGRRSVASVCSNESSASFESLLLDRIKKTDKPVVKRSRVDPLSHVITSEEYGKLIAEKEKGKKEKEEKPKHPRSRPKQKTMTKSEKSRPMKRKKIEETDSEADDVSLKSTDGDEDVDLIEECAPDPVTMTDPEGVVQGDYVLARFQGGKRNAYSYRYVCTVQRVLESDLEVMALESVDTDKMVFKVNEKDVSLIKKTDVVGKLPIPHVANGIGNLKRGICFVFGGPVDVCEKK